MPLNRPRAVTRRASGYRHRCPAADAVAKCIGVVQAAIQHAPLSRERGHWRPRPGPGAVESGVTGRSVDVVAVARAAEAVEISCTSKRDRPGDVVVQVPWPADMLAGAAGRET